MDGYYLYMHIAPNGKMYVGITKQLPQSRWKNGYGYASSPHFYNAILKYGWDNIEHIVLADNLSVEWACKLEKCLIEEYDLTNHENGYNVCVGGGGTNGYHHSEESKQKLRDATLRSLDNGQREQLSLIIKKKWQEGAYANRKHSNVTWNKGLTKDDPRVARCCRKKGEWSMSPESRQKLSNSKKGKPAPNRKRVECIETGIIYASAKEATALTGITNISKAARFGNSACKLHWRYIE